MEVLTLQLVFVYISLKRPNIGVAWAQGEHQAPSAQGRVFHPVVLRIFKQARRPCFMGRPLSADMLHWGGLPSVAGAVSDSFGSRNHSHFNMSHLISLKFVLPVTVKIL